MQSGYVREPAATDLDRKSGGAQWRDPRFSVPFLEMFFDRGVMGFGPPKVIKKRLLSATTLLWKPPLSPLSSRPEFQWAYGLPEMMKIVRTNIEWVAQVSFLRPGCFGRTAL